MDRRHRGVGRSATKVVLTNHASAEYRELSFRLGANQFYDKSFEMLKVLELIRMMAASRAVYTPASADIDSTNHSRT